MGVSGLGTIPKCAILATDNELIVKTVAHRHKLAAYFNKHC